MRAGQGPGVPQVTPQSGERGLERVDLPPNPGSCRAFCKSIRLSDPCGTVSHTRSNPLDIFNYKPCLESTSISRHPQGPRGAALRPQPCVRGSGRGWRSTEPDPVGAVSSVTPKPGRGWGGDSREGVSRASSTRQAQRGLPSPSASWRRRFQMKGPLGTGACGTLLRPSCVSLLLPLPGLSRPPLTHRW